MCKYTCIPVPCIPYRGKFSRGPIFTGFYGCPIHMNHKIRPSKLYMHVLARLRAPTNLNHYMGGCQLWLDGPLSCNQASSHLACLLCQMTFTAEIPLHKDVTHKHTNGTQTSHVHVGIRRSPIR